GRDDGRGRGRPRRRTWDAWANGATRRWATGLQAPIRGGCRGDRGPPISPSESAPHVTGDDGFLVRVPLLYSGAVRTSRPDAARRRTAAGDAPPPTDPTRCPGRRTPRGSIGTGPCSD